VRGIIYNPENPSHILYPGDAGTFKQFYNAQLVWNGTYGEPTYAYFNVDLSGMEGPLVVFPDAAAMALTGALAVRIVGTSAGDTICGWCRDP